MDKSKHKRERRQRAHLRLRRKVVGTADRPRMSVYKSAKYIYVQVVDDQAGRTIAQASSFESAIRKQVTGSGKTRAAARTVGEVAAERAKEQGIQRVVFDRGGYIYHGRVREVAEGARSKGLEL